MRRGVTVKELLGHSDVKVTMQVESAEAIDELPSTVAVPGIDAIMVGPYDLSVSLGIPGELNHPKFNAALERIAGACAASPAAAGIHLGDAARLAECLRMGHRFLIYSTDMALLLKSLREALQDLRGEATTVTAPGMY